MSQRPVIDAGPALNFLSINRERLLIGVLGKLSTPEAVQEEVFRKSRNDPRFRAATQVWRKLTVHNWMRILSDDQTPHLATVTHRITGQTMEARLKHPKDLGELMVIVHAVVAAESGMTVTVLIDDQSGARVASSEINRLEQLRSEGQAVGAIRLVNTPTILRRAAGDGHIPDRAAMHDIYKRLRDLDDGLPPIERTNLLSSDLWH